MDNMTLDQKTNSDNLIFTNDIRSFLYAISKWTKFLAILGFIMIGFMILLAIFMATIMPSFLGSASNIGFMESSTIILMASGYIIFGFIYLFPILYLYRFSSKIIIALDNNDQQILQNSFLNLKKHYKLIGIYTIIILSIYVLTIAFSLMKELIM